MRNSSAGNGGSGSSEIVTTVTETAWTSGMNGISSYTAETKEYTCSALDKSQKFMAFTNLRAKFENGKLVSFHCESSKSSTTITYDFTQIGSTTVTLPQVSAT